MSIATVSSYGGLGSMFTRHIDPSTATAIAEEEAARERQAAAMKSGYTADQVEQDKIAAAAAAEAAARSRSQETYYQAQSLGQDGEAGGVAPSAKDIFLDYMKKSPAERMMEDILRGMGLTKEDLANMTPEERAKIEALIKEKVDAAMQQETEKKMKKEDAAAL